MPKMCCGNKEFRTLYFNLFKPFKILNFLTHAAYCNAVQNIARNAVRKFDYLAEDIMIIIALRYCF